MKRVLFGGGKKHSPVFKVALAELMKTAPEAGRQVPSIVEDTIRVLEQRGLELEGLFRKCPSSADVDRLKKLYDENAPAEQKRLALQTADPHTVAGLLKLFLRELPEPLLTRALYELFVSAGATDDERDRLANMRLLALGLPRENRAVLRVLLRFLRRVADKAEQNKMSVENLAIVFGPTLLATDNPARILTDTQAVINVVLSLITSFDQVFGEPGTTPSRAATTATATPSSSSAAHPTTPKPTPTGPAMSPAPPPVTPLTPVAQVALKTAETTLGPLDDVTATVDGTAATASQKENEPSNTHRDSKRRKTNESVAVAAAAAVATADITDDSLCADSALDTTADALLQQPLQVTAEEVRDTLEQWTATKNAHKQRIMEMDKKRQQQPGGLTADERAALHQAHLQYKQASQQVKMLQRELATAAAPPPLPSPYDEMSIEQLRGVIHKLQQEKRELGQFLVQWRNEFQRKNRRRIASEKDRAPVAMQYHRYQELRVLVDAIQLNLASVVL